jgi:hypothetical protein
LINFNILWTKIIMRIKLHILFFSSVHLVIMHKIALSTFLMRSN